MAGRPVVHLLVPLLAGTLTASPLLAQDPAPPALSGSVSLVRGVTTMSPSFTSRVFVDPSHGTFGPWAVVDLRWDDIGDQGAYPTARLGMRVRRQSMMMAFGFSRDVAYQSLRWVLRRPPDSHCICTSGLSTGGMPVVPTRVGYTRQSVSGLVASTAWSWRRLAIDAEADWRLSGPGQGKPWLSASIATPLTARISLVAGLDQRADPKLSPNASRITLGLAWRSTSWGRRTPVQPSPAAVDSSRHQHRAASDAALSVHRLTSGIRLRLRAPAAAAVEVRSDMTGWEPVALQRTAEGTMWQVDLAAEPGVHRLALRVDGGPWLPPPGLTVGTDGYGMAVGMLVIEP